MNLLKTLSLATVAVATVIFMSCGNRSGSSAASGDNVAVDMLVKQGYDLYFYRNEKSTLEMDFFVRDTYSLVPVEVKA